MDGSLRATFVVLFLFLVGAAAGWVLNYTGAVHAEWVGEWAPHIVASTFELLVAAVVVDGLLRRQEAVRLRPRREASLARLRGTLSQFLTSLTIQYAYMSTPDAEIPRDRATLSLAWMKGLKNSKQRWLPQWFSEFDRLSTALDEVSRRSELVLDSETLALIDRFVQTWSQEEGARLRAGYELTKVAASSVGAADPDGRMVTDEQTRLLHEIIVRALALADRYEELAGEKLNCAPDTVKQFRLAQVDRLATGGAI